MMPPSHHFSSLFRALREGWLALLLAASLLSGCSAGFTPEAPASQSSAGSVDAAAKAQGFDAQRLEQAVQAVSDSGLKVHSLLVYRNSVLVSESYFAGNRADMTHDLYSVTKSFIATLVGIALEEGKIESLQTPVLEYFPDLDVDNPSPEKSAITLEHLLTMTSGLDWEEGDPAYRALYISPDWVKKMLDLPMRGQPGSEFNYCSGCTHLIAAVLERATGENLQKFADERLFQPLDITDYAWQTDSKNTPIGGWGLQLRPRDMAKLGQLYLNGGQWNGQQVVPADWVREASRAHVQVDDKTHYGYLWWVDGAELQVYSARGRYGQYVYVDPERNMVVVTTAALDDMDRLYDLIRDEIVPTVIQ